MLNISTLYHFRKLRFNIINLAISKKIRTFAVDKKKDSYYLSQATTIYYLNRVLSYENRTLQR